MSTTHSPSGSLRASSRNCRCSLPQKMLQALALTAPTGSAMPRRCLPAKIRRSWSAQPRRCLPAKIRRSWSAKIRRCCLSAKTRRCLRRRSGAACLRLLACADRLQHERKGKGAKAKSRNGYGLTNIHIHVYIPLYIYMYLLYCTTDVQFIHPEDLRAIQQVATLCFYVV